MVEPSEGERSNFSGNIQIGSIEGTPLKDGEEAGEERKGLSLAGRPSGLSVGTGKNLFIQYY